MSAAPRLSRLLRDDGRCLMGLFDNGHFGVPTWSGLAPLIGELAGDPRNRAFDGISLPRGSAARLQRLPAGERPALVLRADVTDYWQAGWSGPYSAIPLEQVVEDAVRLDAAAVVTILLRSSAEPALQTSCLRAADRIRARCERYAMPVLIEAAAFVERDGERAADYSTEVLTALAWQAAELGADVVKTDPTVDPADFGEVVAAGCGLPVMAGSGAAGDDDAIAARTAALIAAGASGVGYGGNFTRTADPFGLAERLAAIVHDGVA